MYISRFTIFMKPPTVSGEVWKPSRILIGNFADGFNLETNRPLNVTLETGTAPSNMEQLFYAIKAYTKINMASIGRRGYRNSLRGMRDFEKGKLYKKGKKAIFYINYVLRIRNDSNVLN